MSFSIKLLRKTEQIATAWSGGTTTQLAIYPETAEYAKRNFKWRISSARVEAEESEFTHLPGIWRHIMIIEGELALEHEGHHRSELKPFEQDSFSGEWMTRSRGRVTDFNLMLAEGCKGSIEALTVKGTVQSDIAWDNRPEQYPNYTEVLYCADGSVQITVNGEVYTLQEGDLLRMDMKNPWERISFSLDNEPEYTAVVIKTSIHY